MSKEKINVLFYGEDKAGSNYYRVTGPAARLSKDYGDQFNVEINPSVDWSNIAYLSKFQIIHAHKNTCGYAYMEEFMNMATKLGIKVIIDLDEYWIPGEDNPKRVVSRLRGDDKGILANIKLAHYVTATTPVLADLIRVHNKNVVVIPNAIDDTEAQYKLIEAPLKTDSRAKILWSGGDTHAADIELLGGAFERMRSEAALAGTYQLNLAGFDFKATELEYTINERLIKELLTLKLFNGAMADKLNQVNFDLDLIAEIPKAIKDRYRGNVVAITQKDVDPKESAWIQYEKTFTNNYKLITDAAYLGHLNLHDTQRVFPGQEAMPYVRHKAKSIRLFGNTYRGMDISLAPLKTYTKGKDAASSNLYQSAKSNLKLIEAAFHKVPLIASALSPYTHDADFVDGKNIVLVSPNRQDKDWYKKIKDLVTNPGKREDIGAAAYEVVKDKYNLGTTTKLRAEFYNTLIS